MMALKPNYAKRNAELKAERKRRREEERKRKRTEHEERMSAQAAERMKSEKAKARIAFIQAGGDPDRFEHEWRETIKPRLVEEGTFAAMKRPRRASDFVEF
jgi:uncharacterized protein YegJ (DUF2314 family)